MALAITSFTPATGPATGGTSVTITGTSLDTVDEVLVGNTVAQIVGTPTPTSLTFKTPAHAAGALTVHVVDNDTNTEVGSATPFTYAAVVTPEKLVSSLASKWKLDVDTSAAQDGSNFISVRAITDFQPAVAATTQDDSDYDGNGWGSDVKTQLKWSCTIKLARKRGVTSNAYDPGQEALKAAHDQFGNAGVVLVRWYDRNGGPEAYQGYAQVQWSEDGGNTTALDTVSVTLSGQGQRQLITNPVGS